MIYLATEHISMEKSDKYSLVCTENNKHLQKELEHISSDYRTVKNQILWRQKATLWGLEKSENII